MSRSEVVRREVLERDGRRCQICGKSENLHVHHIQALGMGGSEERDVAENMITLCAECHDKVHAGILHVEEFTPDALIVTDGESRRVSDDQIWFYQRQRTDHLEQVEARIQGLSAIEGDVARDLWELSEGYPLLDPDAVSFAQYTAARGWSSSKATRAAKAFSWVERHGLTWPQGLTAEKMDILRKASSAIEDNLLPVVWQNLLDGAVDQSIADLKRLLIEKGFKAAVTHWYLLIGQDRRLFGRLHTDILFVRSRDYEIVMGKIALGVKVIEVNAFKAGIRWDRKAQKLYDREGNIIRYETWEKEEA